MENATTTNQKRAYIRRRSLIVAVSGTSALRLPAAMGRDLERQRHFRKGS
jgi:hypothetical protein